MFIDNEYMVPNTRDYKKRNVIPEEENESSIKESVS